MPKYQHYNTMYYYPQITHVSSPTGLGYHLFHFKKLLESTYVDNYSPRIFKLSYLYPTIKNFDYDIFKHLLLAARKTSAGFSYKKKYKNMNITRSLYLLSRISYNNVYTVIKYAEKKELLPKEKLLKRGKVRLFSVVDFHVELLMRIFFQKSMNVLLEKEERAYKIGISVFHRQLERMLRYVSGKMHSCDGSSFDSSLSIWIMVQAVILMLQDACYTPFEIAIVVVFFISLITQPRTFNGLFFSLFSCLPSGFFITALLNCYVVEYLSRQIFSKTLNHLYVVSYGDDVSINSQYIDIFCDLSKKHGIDYEKTNYFLFLSFSPIKTQDGYIAKYKEIGKCFSTIAHITLDTSQFVVFNVFFSLFVVYFYHFKYDENAKNYLSAFIYLFEKKNRFPFPYLRFFSKAEEIWFTEAIQKTKPHNILVNYFQNFK